MSGDFSLVGFASFLAGAMAEVEHHKHKALEEAAQIVEDESKRVISTYDYGWTPLKPATVTRKANGDTPLLETGEMRDSIEHTVGHDEAQIGSNNDKAVWQELGTATIPARSFLAGAANAKESELRTLLGKSMVPLLKSSP